MATYDFDQVLVWSASPGGTMRTLRNATVTVVNPANSAILTTVTSDTNGRVAFTTTDVPTVILQAPMGFTRRITSQTAIEAVGGGGGGIEMVSGTVDLTAAGPPVREFYCTGAATIEGVSFGAGATVVWRRTTAGAWGYILVSSWTDAGDSTTTTTTTAATTTTTTTVAADLSASYIGMRAIDTTQSLTQTWSGVAVGTASATRRVVVALGSSNGVNATGVTIGGVTATNDAGSQSGGPGVQWWSAVVPAGTTATVVANMSGATPHVGMGAWVITGGNSIPPTPAGPWVSYSNPSALSVVAGGIAFASCAQGSQFGNTYTDYTLDMLNFVSTFTVTAASKDVTSTGTVNNTVGSTGVAPVYAALCYRPGSA